MEEEEVSTTRVDHKRRKFAPKSSQNVNRPVEPTPLPPITQETLTETMTEQTLYPQEIPTSPVNSQRARGNVIISPQPQRDWQPETDDGEFDSQSIATTETQALPPAFFALKNVGKGEKSVKIKLPPAGQSWASLTEKKKRKSAKGRSLWSSGILDEFLELQSEEADAGIIRAISFMELYAEALDSAKDIFANASLENVMQSQTFSQATTTVTATWGKLIEQTIAAGKTFLEQHPDPDDKDLFTVVSSQFPNVDFVNVKEETATDMIVDPDLVIQNLTLSQVIDNFDGSIPTKNQERRERNRIEKAVLTRHYRRRAKLEEMGIALPPHLQNLPPKSEPIEERDNLRTPSRTPSMAPETPEVDRAAPQVRIIDGQVVLDEASLMVEPKMTLKDLGGFQSMDRDHGDKPITSYTYMRRKNHADRWTDQEDERFYECLSYWGTDLSMASKCFPSRPYKQIKAKFLREERTHPNKVREALMNRKRCDPARFREMTGMEVAKLEVVDLQPLQELEEKIAEQITEREKAVVLKEHQPEEPKAQPESIKEPTPQPEPTLDLEIAEPSRKTVTGKHRPNLARFSSAQATP